MKLKNAKRVMAAAMLSVMTLSLAACGGKDTTPTDNSSKKETSAKDVERPEAVSEEESDEVLRLREKQ